MTLASDLKTILHMDDREREVHLTKSEAILITALLTHVNEHKSNLSISVRSMVECLQDTFEITDEDLGLVYEDLTYQPISVSFDKETGVPTIAVVEFIING